MRGGCRLTALVVALATLSLSPWLAADIVNIVDPAGGGEIDAEVGNLSQAAFEALVPDVNDHENDTGPQGADTPFTIGSVSVTGAYGLGASGTGIGTGNPYVLASISGGRTSFTVSGVDGLGDPAGTWMYADVDPLESTTNYVRFEFAAAPGESVRAVGLGWIGRDNRAGNSELTAKVTFADGSSMSSTPLEIDGTGDGLPNGKDVFVGFEDTGDHGGIIRLEVRSIPLFVSNGIVFHGWDDIGVVTGPATPFTPVPVPTVSEWALIAMGLMLAAGLIVGARRRFAQAVPG